MMKLRLLGALGLFLVALFMGSQLGQPASATHDPGSTIVDIVAVDAISTENTATSIGTIQDCVSIPVNGTAVIDIVVDQVPAEGTQGLGADLLYASGIVQITSFDDHQMLYAGGGTQPFAIVDQVPDTDGGFRMDTGDISPNAESGAGVLVRIGVQGLAVGVSPLDLNDVSGGDGIPDVFNTAAATYDVSNTLDATLFVGQPCPNAVDVKVTTVTTTAPSAATIATPFNVTVGSTLHNNGPADPVNTDVAITLNMPPDCSTTSANPVILQDQSLVVSAPVNLAQQSFSVTCTGASNHAFNAGAVTTIDSIGVFDIQPNNNALTSANSITVIGGNADIEVLSVSVSAPATETVGTLFTITANASLRNNGPAIQPSVKGVFTLTLPPDCIVVFSNVRDTTFFTLVDSSPVTFPMPPVSFPVYCNNYGVHAFSVHAAFSLEALHIGDPVSANNSATSPASVNLFVGACGDDPAPAGDPLQNMSPLLITVIQQLTADGTPVPAENTTPLNCDFNLAISDGPSTPVDDCEVDLVTPVGCSVTFETLIEELGGQPALTPTARLLPVSVLFLSANFNIAQDPTIPNGSPAGSGSFQIRTDGGLTPNGTPCVVDAIFPSTPGVEGGVPPNAPESNDSDDITNPLVWPNDLNGERATVEAALTVNPLPLPVPPPVTLWSRIVVPLEVPGLSLPFNILIWRIDDVLLRQATGAGWVAIGLPGDAINPDAPGTIGGDPDADDPPPPSTPLITCAPNAAAFTLNGTAGASTYVSCTLPGSHFGWALMDPDALNVTGDDGPRSDVSPCSLDIDNDGLTQNEETFYGTTEGIADTDGDGVLDGPDNCKLVPNVDQANNDGDAQGDLCDPDDDNDGALDGDDNCVFVFNPGQQNAVHSATGDGDHCEDPDADAVADFDDNCPDTANPGQQNIVHAGTPAGDHCEDPDMDGDFDAADNCPDVPNPLQQNVVNPGTPAGDLCEDTDGDGVTDNPDNCPTVVNPGQQNLDGDVFGDLCDNCPAASTPWNVPAGDADCDGFPSIANVAGRGRENYIGTDPSDNCADTVAPNDERGPAFGEPLSPWPTDMNDNKLTSLQDVILFVPHFGTTLAGPNPGGTTYNQRFDINANNSVTLSDILTFIPFFNKVCSP